MGARLMKNSPHPSRLSAGLANEARFYLRRVVKLEKAIKLFKETKTTGDMQTMFDIVDDGDHPSRVEPGNSRQ